MRLRLLDRLNEHASRCPGAPAVMQVSPVAPRGAVSYGELDRWARALAGHLAAHVAEGEVVVLASPNGPSFIAAFLAILAAGAKGFPVSPELTEPELLSAAERSSATAVIGVAPVLAALKGRVRWSMPVPDLPPPHAPAVPPARDHSKSGLLLQSSGTTGRPKIVFRGARALDAVAEAMCRAIGFTSADRVLLPLPLCHSYGLEHGLLAPVWAGSSVCVSQGFDLKLTLEQLTAGGVTIFPGVPFMFEALSQAGGGALPPDLRRAYSAGGPLPGKVSAAFTRRFGRQVSQLYGATEIGSVAYSDPDAVGFDPRSVGRAMDGVSIRILDPRAPRVHLPLPPGNEGHVAVRAASMLGGYVPEEPLPLADRYFLTGDLGRLDARGNLTITGRMKLLIDVGGLKVNPLEVEEVLAQHPDVEACVVVPVRVSDTVCRLKAVVAPRSGGPEICTASLRRFARERLAPYKVPRVFATRHSLPRSATGKVLRHLVEV